MNNWGNRQMVTKWWQNEVVYQIYPRSFQDTNHDGIGDIQGMINHLDYIRDLGVTMIWVSPIYKSPMVDMGYDIADYQDIDPQFGPLDDFKTFLSEAKKRHIKVIMDLVVNHTSDQHDWFKQALADPQSKYRDYFIFKKTKMGKCQITGVAFLAVLLGNQLLVNLIRITSILLRHNNQTLTGKILRYVRKYTI